MKTWLTLGICYFAFVLPTFGQLTIDFPLENGVYQRKKNNTLDVVITGRYTDTLTTTLEARLLNPATQVPLAGFDWRVIDSLPQLGKFNSTLFNVPGGRYHLQVRSLNGLKTLETTTVQHIGIGEVFMVSGQSNAAGFQEFGSISAQSDQVVSHDYSDDQTYDVNTTNIPFFPTFAKIEYDTYISEKGQSSWCYGKLGDLLTTRLGVPVSFFNGASVGTSSKNWMESARGLPTQNEYFAAQYGNLVGMPYVHFKNILNYYGSQFGARANLWHQGETDTFKNYSTQYYVDNLTVVKNQSRTDFNPSLSWVISRVSFDGSNSSPQIIGGQNTVVQADINSFYGPETDDITYRNPAADDDVHFFGSSLIDLANKWDLELDNNFLDNSTPVLPTPVQEIKVRYENGLVWLIAPPNYRAYRWIDVTNGNKNYEQTPESAKALIKKSSGKYICYLTENNGNIVPSQIIDVGATLLMYNKSLSLCESATFLSDLTETNLTGEFKKDISQNNTTLRIDGEQFTKGLGSHSYFKITYALPANTYQRFKSFIGVDDSITTANCESHDGVQYKVYGDDPNTPIFTSQTLNADSPIQYIDLAVQTYSSLTLEVLQVGNFNCDHANWADAKLTSQSVSPPVISIDKPVINSGQSVQLAATVACEAGNTIRWSDGQFTIQNSTIPENTTFFYATCIKSQANCQSNRSNTVGVTVLKDCASSYLLLSPSNDISGGSTDLTYRVSTTIGAANKIQTNARVLLDAQQAVTLSPGFVAEYGTTFTAQIGGCAN